MTIRIVKPAEAHRQAWERLYAAYAEFYRVEQTAAMRDRVWRLITDEDEEEEGFLAVHDGAIVGLAHFRKFTRLLSASRGGFLDDLFVEGGSRSRVRHRSDADRGRGRTGTQAGMDGRSVDNQGRQLPRPRCLRSHGGKDCTAHLRHRPLNGVVATLRTGAFRVFEKAWPNDSFLRYEVPFC